MSEPNWLLRREKIAPADRCPRCCGTGWIGEPAVECGGCNGKGEVRVPMPALRWSGASHIWRSGRAASCSVDVVPVLDPDSLTPKAWGVRITLLRQFSTVEEAQKAAERVVSLAMLDDDRWTPERDLASELRTAHADLREALDALEGMLGRRNGKMGPFGPEQREAARLVLVKHGRYPATDPEAQARLRALGEKAGGEHG